MDFKTLREWLLNRAPNPLEIAIENTKETFRAGFRASHSPKFPNGLHYDFHFIRFVGSTQRSLTGLNSDVLDDINDLDGLCKEILVNMQRNGVFTIERNGPNGFRTESVIK